MVLVPRAFLKYSTCMVYSEFLLSGKNPPLEGGGGPKTYCKLEPKDLTYYHMTAAQGLLEAGDILASSKKSSQGIVN